ncbi:MAG: hypothetical protein RRC07_01025 [Anaerolineae bacterium]|nr:hypothetical protein [Anaerolineae bacterium]
MVDKQRFALIVSLIAVVVVAGLLAIGWRLIRGDDSLLRRVAVAETLISPNADGDKDITEISYTLSRNATVSIYVEDDAGDRYYFRQEQPRGAGDYSVYFSGVVDGYQLPGEDYAGQILARLLQDGAYTWVVEAVDENGHVENDSGSLTIVEADAALPEIRDFTLSRRTFTPNQDGISDRVQMEFFLPKEVETIRVFLLLPDGTELPVPEQPTEVPPGAEGRHVYDWSGGVDESVSPPDDGTYPVIAYAADAEGQKYRVEEELTIELGGVPYANIISPVTGDTLAFNTTSMTLCDTIYFTVTVENYGDAPIRSVGPWVDAVYDSDWNYNTMGWPTEAGAWRVGIGYENALSDYPFRWGLGSPETLTEIDGQYYLMPGERAVVRGGIRVVDVFGVRNPQPVWAGLIHEDVDIAEVNQHVDTQQIRVEIPSGVEVPDCEQRTAPVQETAGK